MAHLVFHIVAEDPQKQHISGQMHNTAMDEHGGEQGERCVPHHDLARDSSESGVEQRHTAVGGEARGIPKIAKNIGCHQQIDDIGRSARWVVVAQRKHALTLSR